MKTCLILDTNFLLSYNKELKEIKDKIKDLVDIYIPRIVIEEIQGQKSRNLEESHSKIEDLLKQNSKYFTYVKDFKLEEVKLKRESGIKKSLSAYCDNNIIEYQENLFKKIVQRAVYKIPPFINELGSSDKGFKDTILWCSILNFDKIKDYDKFILISDDKQAFHKKADYLTEEFNETTTKEIIIIKSDLQTLYDILGLSKKDKISVEKEEVEIEASDINSVHSLKEKLNMTMQTILYSTFYNEYQDEEYTEKNFTIHQKLKEKDLELFFEKLPQYISTHIFFDYIDITELLSSIGIDCEYEHKVSLQALEDLQDIHQQISEKNNLYSPFLTFLLNQFNYLYQLREIDDESFENNSTIEIDDDFLS